jgi:hypothetical protein
VVIGATTVDLGAVTVINNTPISIDPGAIIIAPANGSPGSIFLVPTNGAQPNPKPTGVTVTSVGSTPVVLDPSGDVVIGGQALTPGDPALTISGTPITVNPTALIIGTSTLRLPNSTPATIIPVAVITLGSQTVTALPTGVLIASTLLTIGGPALTTNSETISLGPSGIVIVDPTGRTTVPFSARATYGPTSESTGALGASGTVVLFEGRAAGVRLARWGLVMGRLIGIWLLLGQV